MALAAETAGTAVQVSPSSEVHKQVGGPLPLTAVIAIPAGSPALGSETLSSPPGWEERSTMSETSVPSPGPGAPASSVIVDMGYVPATSVGGWFTSANAGAAMTANAPAASTPARKPLRAKISRVCVRWRAGASVGRAREDSNLSRPPRPQLGGP